MHTITVVRSMKRPNCDSDRFLVRIRSINKIMNMTGRCNKRTKWNSETLKDAIISQKLKHGVIKILVRQAVLRYTAGMESYKICTSERAQGVLGK